MADHTVTTSLRGILPATITPFDDSERFAPAVFERLLERLYGAGVHGIYVCGSTGEGMLQPLAQRQAIVETAVACTPRDRHVVVHVGAASLEEALALSSHAAKAGAHAISSLPPLAGRFSFSEVLAYYDALARGSDLPLLVYYFPEVSASITTTDQLETLCALPNVIGLKFTDFDLFRMAQVRGAGRSIFNGRDEVLAAGLLMGADGGIGTFYNLVPELFVDIHAAAGAGRWEEARTLQERVNALIALTLRFPVFPAVKQMLAWSGLDCGACLPPRTRLDEEQQRLLSVSLVEAGFLELVAPS
ncbi:MAG: dihydrodipicolinate synthetase [Gemmatimonadetes bacterium]|nr:dihydrodipicolinate synthetase [Gemmatimonadota bacterium]